MSRPVSYLRTRTDTSLPLSLFLPSLKCSSTSQEGRIISERRRRRRRRFHPNDHRIIRSVFHPFTRESASIASSAKSSFENGTDRARRVKFVPFTSPSPSPSFLPSSVLLSPCGRDTLELLNSPLLFQNPGRVITRTRFCSRARPRRRGRRKAEEGQSAFQRAAKTVSEIEDRSVDGNAATRGEGKACASAHTTLRRGPNRPKSTRSSMLAGEGEGRGRRERGERERLFVA